MSAIRFTRDATIIIREITKELKKSNKLKEAELRLKYGDIEYYDIINRMDMENYMRKRG